MRPITILLLLICLHTPALSQEARSGYLIQTAITPESYLVTSTEEFQSFLTMLPKVTPFKTLPATPNPDPFLKGHSPDFGENILVIATGRDRINQPPIFRGVETLGDGSRRVLFWLPKRTEQTYPYGWGVYTVVSLPRIQATTKVVVDVQDDRGNDEFQRGDFKRAKFKRL